MNAKYFSKDMGAADLKKAYRKLALKYHPDVSELSKDDATKIMTEINAEFAFFYAIAATREVRDDKVNNNPRAENVYQDRYNSTFVNDLQSAIEWLLSHSIYTRKDLTAEIVGVFIWISGAALKDEKDTRQTLKNSNFRYSADKKAWYYTPSSTAGMIASGKNLDQIRSKYGSVNIYGKNILG